jgi:hypothetical protein
MTFSPYNIAPTQARRNSSSLPGVPYPCQKIQDNVFWTPTQPWLDRPWHYQDYLWWVHGILQAIHGWPSYQKSLDFRLDSGSSWLDGVNSILMQQEPNLPKQDYWNQRAIASLANTLITVVEPVPMPLLSSMLLLQL